MIGRAPREGEVLAMERTVGGELHKYRCTQIGHIWDGTPCVRLERLDAPDRGNRHYSLSWFTNKNGVTNHGEWFFPTSDRYERWSCACGASYVVAPGQESPGRCPECQVHTK